MNWRKWLVRGLVFSALGGMALAWVLYQAWTNPAAIRRQLLDRLGARFPGAVVSLESARLRLLDGIAVSDLRLARRDDLERTDFLYVPSAVIYHDKEHLLTGNIRKVILDRPRLRVIRERDGRWNLQGLVAGGGPAEHLPTLLVRQGTLVLEDRTRPAGGPLLEVRDVTLTAVNDPFPLISVEGKGQTDVLGPVRISATIRRTTGEVAARLEMPGIPVGPTLVQRLVGPFPELAPHLRQLRGTGSLKGTLAYAPGAARPLTYRLDARLTGGEWSHARLPVPLEHLDVSVRCENGLVPLARLSADAGPAHLGLTVRDLGPSPSPVAGLDELAREYDFTVEHLPVTPELFAYLPEPCQFLKTDYAPAGPVSLSCTFRRTGASAWRKHWVYHPEGMSGEFCHFRYPFGEVAGTVVSDTTSAGTCSVHLDLAGKAGGSPIALRGDIEAGKAGSATLALTGTNFPLDDRLFEALPEKSRRLARQFLPAKSRQFGLRAHPLGLADFTVNLERPVGQPQFANAFHVKVHDAAVQYDPFPLPLENVSALLNIYPDHWDCQHFRGTHKGGEIQVEARSERLPPPRGTPGFLPALDPTRASAVPAAPGELVQVTIKGTDVLLDEEFEDALSPRGPEGRGALQKTWKTLALRGRMNFNAEVRDRPDMPQDLDVGVHIRGCTMQPRFFPFALDKVEAKVRYTRGRVYLRDVQARHGGGTLGLRSGVVALKPAGGFTAWLSNIEGKGLVPDADFLHGLPEPLARGIKPLELRQPLDVHTDLTLDTDGEAGSSLKVWWEGGVTLTDATLQSGVSFTRINGQLCSRGYHDGKQLVGLEGDVLLHNLEVLGQPFRNVHANVSVRPDFPDHLRLHNIKADLFGGSVGGQALVKIGPPLEYDVFLRALEIQLDQFGRHNLGNDAQVQGPVRASVHLTGKGTDLTDLKGHGELEVARGKLYRLPLMLDLLKALGLRVPDRTAFEQARMIFAIDGPQLRVEKLDLYGSAISLRGQGTVNLDGSNLELDFNADWGRIPGMLPAPLSNISRALSDQVLKIKMRGKLGKGGNVRFDKELAPGVVEPLKRAFGGSP